MQLQSQDIQLLLTADIKKKETLQPEKYLRKGTKVVVTGRIQTGSYTNKDGQKVYTTDVVVEENEFAESKRSDDNAPASSAPASMPEGNGFMNIPDGIDEELPFN